MLLTGETIEADEALRIGPVNRVASPGELRAATEDCREGTRAFLGKTRPAYRGR